MQNLVFSSKSQYQSDEESHKFKLFKIITLFSKINKFDWKLKFYLTVITEIIKITLKTQKNNFIASLSIVNYFSIFSVEKKCQYSIIIFENLSFSFFLKKNVVWKLKEMSAHALITINYDFNLSIPVTTS